MELEFKKVGSRYEAEFEAIGNFNLNIERVAPEKIQVFQKGAEDGEYASQASWYNNYASAIVDYDFSALIYPKWIKVVSYSEPIQAIVTMDGESGGSDSSGVNIVPLIDQCRVTAVDYGGDVNADGGTILPDENGVFTSPAIESGVIRVFTPYLYVPAVADLITSYYSSAISWNKNKQCFDIQLNYLPETFTLSIIE